LRTLRIGEVTLLRSGFYACVKFLFVVVLFAALAGTERGISFQTKYIPDVMGDKKYAKE